MKSEPLRGPTPTAGPAPAGLRSPVHHSVLTSLLAANPHPMASGASPPCQLPPSLLFWAHIRTGVGQVPCEEKVGGYHMERGASWIPLGRNQLGLGIFYK